MIYKGRQEREGNRARKQTQSRNAGRRPLQSRGGRSASQRLQEPRLRFDGQRAAALRPTRSQPPRAPPGGRGAGRAEPGGPVGRGRVMATPAKLFTTTAAWAADRRGWLASGDKGGLWCERSSTR